MHAAGNPRTGEPGNREQVVSIQKQISMAGEIDPQHSSCPCSCHIQHPHNFQMEAQNSPMSNSQSNRNAPTIPSGALAQNSPSSLSNKGEPSSSSEKTNFEQYAVVVVDDDDETQQQQQQPKLQREKTAQKEKVNAAYVVSESNNDDCQAMTIPSNRLKFNVDYQICGKFAKLNESQYYYLLKRIQF